MQIKGKKKEIMSVLREAYASVLNAADINERIAAADFLNERLVDEIIEDYGEFPFLRLGDLVDYESYWDVREEFLDNDSEFSWNNSDRLNYATSRVYAEKNLIRFGVIQKDGHPFLEMNYALRTELDSVVNGLLDDIDRYNSFFAENGYEMQYKGGNHNEEHY